MSQANDLIIEQLREAQTLEQSSLSLLEGHLRSAPPGAYRTAARRHLQETRRHAQQVGERLTSLGASHDPLQLAITLGEAVVGRLLGAALAPLGVLRGSSGSTVVLRHVQEEIASEAREAAAYGALERLAAAAGDRGTASLARTIRADEERQLETLRELVETLADRVAQERLGPRPVPVAAPPPAAEPAARRPAGATNGGPVAAETETPYRERAERLRRARREAGSTPEGPTPGQAARLREREREEETEGTVASEGAAAPGAEVRVDAPWDGYDDMKAGEIVERLRNADASVRAVVRLYESGRKRRKTVLQATEP